MQSFIKKTALLFFTLALLSSAAFSSVEKIGSMHLSSSGPSVNFFYDSETGKFSKSFGNLGDNGLLREDLQSMGTIPGLTTTDISVYGFNSLWGGSDSRDVIIIRHGSWFSLVRVETDELITSNIGPIKNFRSNKFLRAYFPPESVESKEYFFFVSQVEKQKNTEEKNNKDLVTHASLIPAEQFGSSDLQTVLFIVGEDGKVNWMPLRNDIKSVDHLFLYRTGDSSWTIELDESAEHIEGTGPFLKGLATINLETGIVAEVVGGVPLTHDSLKPIELISEGKNIYTLADMKTSDNGAELAIRSMNQMVKKPNIRVINTVNWAKKQKALEEDVNTGANSSEDDHVPTLKFPKAPDVPPTASNYLKGYTFTNGTRLVTERKDAVYTLYFVEKGKKTQLMTSSNLLQFPVDVKEWTAFHPNAYSKQKGAATVSVVTSDAFSLVHQDGTVQKLPFDYAKVDTLLQPKSMISIHIEKQNYLVASLKYSDAYQLKEVQAGLPPLGETFLVRESDGLYLRVDYNFHEVELNAAKTIVQGLSLRDGILTVGNSERSIDIRAFDAEAKFVVEPSQYIEVELTAENGNKYKEKQSALAILQQRYENVSKRQKFKREAYESLDPKVERKIRQALLHPTKGSAVIVGESGVGKTEVLDSFTADAVAGKFAEIPRTWQFFRFSIVETESGTKYTGMFAERVREVLESAKKVPLVLLVDEIQTLRGGGTHSESKSDIMQSFKRAMSKGKLHMLGTSTWEEFVDAYSGDRALIRRFATITKEEPKGEDLFKVLASWCKMHGFAVPSREILSYAIAQAGDMNAVGAQPSKTMDLLAQSFSIKALDKKNGTELTREDIDQGTVDLHDADVSFFDEAKRNEKLDALPAFLESHLIGMDDAKKAVANLVEQDYVGVNDPNLPALRVFFVGPTGTGKTEFAKRLAEGLGRQFKRIEMTQYAAPLLTQFKNEVAEQLQKNAFSVICLDEFEKAHPDVRSEILSMLDSGMFTVQKNLGSGFNSAKTTITVNARKAYFIVTSNAAAGWIQEKLLGSGDKKVGFSTGGDSANSKQAGLPKIDPYELHNALIQVAGIAPEVLRRFQKIIYTSFPTQDEFRQILNLHIAKAAKEVGEALNLKLVLSEIDLFLDGAIEKYYRKNINGGAAQVITADLFRSPIAGALRKGVIKKGQTVKVTFNVNGVETVERAKAKAVSTSDCVKALKP